jgi:hypothetical protein
MDRWAGGNAGSLASGRERRAKMATPTIPDGEAKERVTKAIMNHRPTIHDISIGTGLPYHQVVRIVLQGLASNTYRLEVNTRDGVAGKRTDSSRD